MSSSQPYDEICDDNEELYDDLENEKFLPANKRQRRHEQQQQVPNDRNDEREDEDGPFAFFSNDDDLLSDDLMGIIFEYLPQQFRFVAGTCKRFHRIYKGIHTNKRKDDDDKKIKNKKIKNEKKEDECPGRKISTNGKKSMLMNTSMQSVVESVSRVNLYLKERTVVTEDHLLFKISDFAALYGNVTVLRYALRKLSKRFYHKIIPRPAGCRICNNAAKNGHLNLLKVAREEFNCSWNPSSVMIHAAGNGHVEILKWARQNGYSSWGEYLCLHAAAGGRLEVLIWLRSNCCPWGKETSTYAARNGHLGILMWLQSNGCPWDENTCAAAARNNHLHVLQWAHQNGCPWNEMTTSGARRFGHMHVLEWAKSNGCPDDEEGEEDLLGIGFDEVLNGV